MRRPTPSRGYCGAGRRGGGQLRGRARRLPLRADGASWARAVCYGVVEALGDPAEVQRTGALALLDPCGTELVAVVGLEGVDHDLGIVGDDDLDLALGQGVPALAHLLGEAQESGPELDADQDDGATAAGVAHELPELFDLAELAQLEQAAPATAEEDATFGGVLHQADAGRELARLEHGVTGRAVRLEALGIAQDDPDAEHGLEAGGHAVVANADLHALGHAGAASGDEGEAFLSEPLADLVSDVPVPFVCLDGTVRATGAAEDADRGAALLLDPGGGAGVGDDGLGHLAFPHLDGEVGLGAGPEDVGRGLGADEVIGGDHWCLLLQGVPISGRSVAFRGCHCVVMLPFTTCDMGSSRVSGGAPSASFQGIKSHI